MAKRTRENDEDIQISEPARKVKKIPKIFDGQFFELVGWDGQALNITARCQICKKPFKGQHTSTGNYFKHYKYEKTINMILYIEFRSEYLCPSNIFHSFVLFFRINHEEEYKQAKEYCESKSDKPIEIKRTQTTLPFVNILDPKKVNYY